MSSKQPNEKLTKKKIVKEVASKYAAIKASVSYPVSDELITVWLNKNVKDSGRLSGSRSESKTVLKKTLEKLENTEVFNNLTAYIKSYKSPKKNSKKNTQIESDTGAIIPPDTEHIGMEIASANTDGIINNAQHLNSGDSKQTINTEQSTQSDLIQLNNINAFNANYGNNVAAPIVENQLPTETNNVLTPGGLVKVPIISIRDNVEIIKQIEERTPAGKAWTKEQEDDLKRMFGPLIRQQNASYRDQLSINHGISNDYVEKMINASRGVFFDTRKTNGKVATVKKVQRPYAAEQ